MTTRSKSRPCLRWRCCLAGFEPPEPLEPLEPPDPAPPASLGIHGYALSKPNERLARAAVASDTTRRMISSDWRRPASWSISIPTMTAANTHAGMPKKNLTFGNSAAKTQKIAISTGRMPDWVMPSNVPTRPGTSASSSSRNANLVRPIIRSSSPPKIHSIAIVASVHTLGSL